MISFYGTQNTINGSQVSNLEDDFTIETLLSELSNETMIDTEGLEAQYTPTYSVLSLGNGIASESQTTFSTGRQDLLETLGYPSINNSLTLLEDIPEVTLTELNIADILDNLPDIGNVLDNVKDAVGNVLDNLPDVVGDALDNVQDAVGNVLDNLPDAVGNVLDNVKDTVGDVLGNIGGGIGNILGNLFGKGD